MEKRIRSFFHKYKHLWPLLYFFIYMPWFIILENNVTDNYHIMHCFMDDIIPFNELFIIPYLLWFLYLPAIFVFLFYHSTNEFYRLCAYEFTGMTICLLIYTIFPNGHDLRIDPGIRDNIFVNLVNFIYNNDTPTNVCPSIHVFATLSAQICLIKSPHMKELKSRKRIKWFTSVLAVLICLSTVFLKQHSFIDLVCGILLSLTLYLVAFKVWFKNVKFNAPYVKDPHKHEVLYFLNKYNKK